MHARPFFNGKVNAIFLISRLEVSIRNLLSWKKKKSERIQGVWPHTESETS